MKNWLLTIIVYAIPLLILGTSIWVMTMEPTKQQNRQFIEGTKLIEEQVIRAQWDEAESELRTLEKVYSAARPRIQFSMERNEMNDVEVSLTRLHSYLVAADSTGALVSTEEARYHWANLNH